MVPDPAPIVEASVSLPDGVHDRKNALYTKKVTNAVLGSPVAQSVKKTSKSKGEINVDAVLETPRRSNRLANKPKSDLNMEQQATILLMKKCGTYDEDDLVAPEKGEQLGQKFVEPLDEELVENLRETFGLPKVGEAGCLAAIAVNAEA